jgi:tripartite-type tricarboxylate transporter receptor subunit TctC
LAREKPGDLTCAHASGALHIACAWLEKSGSVDLNLVPYTGGAQAVADVVGGHVDMTFGVLQTVAPHARARRVNVLATTGARRGQGPLGYLPTVSETLPGFELVSWLGIFVPAGTPSAILLRLNREIADVLRQEDVRTWIGKVGLEVAGGSSASFSALIKSDHARYREIISRTGIRVE